MRFQDMHFEHDVGSLWVPLPSPLTSKLRVGHLFLRTQSISVVRVVLSCRVCLLAGTRSCAIWRTAQCHHN